MKWLRSWLRTKPKTTEYLPGVDWSKISANLLISGRTGSGKSTLLLELIANTAREGLGMTITCAKVGDFTKIMAVLESAGRKDISVISPVGNCSLNFLDLPAAPGLGAISTAALMAGVVDDAISVISRMESGHGEDGHWRAGAQSFLRFAIALLIINNQKVTPGNILRVIITSAQSHAELETEAWQESYHGQLIRQAFEQYAGTPGYSEAREICQWWTRTRVSYPDRQAAGYLGHILPGLELLSAGSVGQLIGAEHPTINAVGHVESGGILIVNTPIVIYGNVGLGVQRAVISAVQTSCLARTVTKDTIPHLLVIDEYAEISAERDARFLSLSRSSLAISVLATQCIEQLKSKFPKNGDSVVAGIVGNSACHLVCLPTPETAKWLCDMAGSEVKMMFAGSTPTKSYDSIGDLINQSGRGNASWSQQVVPMLFPHQLTGLRTGADGVVEYWIIGQGKPALMSLKRGVK